jgi:acid ceramidase
MLQVSIVHLAKHARVRPMPSWTQRQTIAIDLNQTPAERYRVLPDEAIAQAKSLLGEVLKDVPDNLNYLADMVRLRTANRFHPEALAIADRADTHWRSIMIANVSYDLMLAVLGCSTMAMATPEGPVLARNMDWWPEDLLAQATYQFSYEHEGQMRFATAGWPGAIGVVTGMSAAGFAVALNAVTGPEGPDKMGYPVLLHLRRLLEDAKSFDEALAMLRDTRLASSALFTLVGKKNSQRVVIERSPTSHALRYPADDSHTLITTNHYQKLFKREAQLATQDATDTTGSVGATGSTDTSGATGSDIYETTCGRLSRMKEMCKALSPAHASDDAALLYILSDPGVLSGITAQQIVMRPYADQMNTYVPSRLLSA